VKRPKLLSKYQKAKIIEQQTGLQCGVAESFVYDPVIITEVLISGIHYVSVYINNCSASTENQNNKITILFDIKPKMAT